MHDVPGDADLEGERLAGPRWRGVKGHIAAEQAVDPLAAVAQVGPQPADQQQVGLAGFDDQAGGHAARGVEVPGVGPHVGLGPDAALAERARRGVDPDHPVGQQQGRSRHPGLAHVGVLDGEHRAEQIGEPAGGEVLELGAVEARAGAPGRRRGDDRRDRRCGGGCGDGGVGDRADNGRSLAGRGGDELRGGGTSGQEAGVRGGLEVQVLLVRGDDRCLPGRRRGQRGAGRGCGGAAPDGRPRAAGGRSAQERGPGRAPSGCIRTLGDEKLRAKKLS